MKLWEVMIMHTIGAIFLIAGFALLLWGTVKIVGWVWA